jgi:hypothetical protein
MGAYVYVVLDLACQVHGERLVLTHGHQLICQAVCPPSHLYFPSGLVNCSARIGAWGLCGQVWLPEFVAHERGRFLTREVADDGVRHVVAVPADGQSAAADPISNYALLSDTRSSLQNPRGCLLR